MSEIKYGGQHPIGCQCYLCSFSKEVKDKTKKPLTDYERGYAAAIADCRRVVETELEYPTAQTPNDGYDDMFEKMKSHPREAVAVAVSLTKKSILYRMPSGPKDV